MARASCGLDGSGSHAAQVEAGEPLQADGVLVEEAPRLLQRWPTVKPLDELALSMHARRLMHIAGSSEALPTVAMLFHPMFQPNPRDLRADVVAYHAYDLFADSPGWSGRSGKREDALLRDADLVSTVTPAIAEQLTRRVNRLVRILPNGVDTAAFAAARQQRARAASALEGIAQPRIGHVGNMKSKVDFSVIAELAAQRPTYHFVLLGSETGGRDEETEPALARCRAIPNVHFVGHRDRREMSGILVSIDVNAIFYRVSEKSWALSGYPLKLD